VRAFGAVIACAVEVEDVLQPAKAKAQKPSQQEVRHWFNAVYAPKCQSAPSQAKAYEDAQLAFPQFTNRKLIRQLVKEKWDRGRGRPRSPAKKK